MVRVFCWCFGVAERVGGVLAVTTITLLTTDYSGSGSIVAPSLNATGTPMTVGLARDIRNVAAGTPVADKSRIRNVIIVISIASKRRRS